MRVLLEHDDGSKTVLTADILPEGSRVILMRMGAMLMPAEMARLSENLSKDIGIKTVLLPVYIKDIIVLPDSQ